MCIANASRCAMGAVLVIGLIAFIYREVPPRTPHKVERFTTLWPQLESAFYKATDRVVSLPQPWFPIEPTPVSVVDSAVDTPPPRPGRARWEHGRAIDIRHRSAVDANREMARARVYNGVLCPYIPCKRHQDKGNNSCIHIVASFC